MCYGCWAESGCPQVDTPEVRELGRMSRAINEFGGFHIVIGDWNLDDECIEFCMQHPDSTETERAWGARMMVLTDDERASVMAIHDNWWKPDQDT